MGVTKDLVAKNNEQSIEQTINALNDSTRGLIFSNLVDFDMLFGHRRDTEGYAKALEHFDARLPEIESAMREDDVLMITADHGNDPTFRGSDHTREYAPLLVYGKTARAGVNLGTAIHSGYYTNRQNFGCSCGCRAFWTDFMIGRLTGFSPAIMIILKSSSFPWPLDSCNVFPHKSSYNPVPRFPLVR